MLGVIQAMSDEKPENGWFIPNCGTDGASIFLSSDESSGEELARKKRKNVRIPLFAKPETKKNVMQVLFELLQKAKHMILKLPKITPNCSMGIYIC